MQLVLTLGEDRFKLKVQEMLRQKQLEAFASGDHAECLKLREISDAVSRIAFGEVSRELD